MQGKGSQFIPTLDHVKNPERLLKVIRDLATQLYGVTGDVVKMREGTQQELERQAAKRDADGHVLRGARQPAEALVRLGVDGNATVKSNLSAGGAPGATDDSTKGYAIGSKWVDTSADDVYFCTNASPGAAVWRGPL